MKCLYVGLLLPVAVFAQDYSPDIRTTWNPGFPDSMESISAIEVNLVQDYGAANDSSKDASILLQNALDDLSSTGGTLYLPEGSYRLDNQISINSDNIRIRGAGLTRLYSSFSGNSIQIARYDRGNWQSLVSAQKESREITVTNGSAFLVGDFVEITQDNDSALMYTIPDWNVSWALQAVGQVAEITAINGNVVQLRHPLHYSPRFDLNPVVRPQGFRKNVILEDFFIEKTSSSGHTIEITNAAYIRVNRIESSHTYLSHVEANTVLGCEITNNYFHHSYTYGGCSGGCGYGASLHYHTTDCLVEDNVFVHLRHSMIAQAGAVGNVIAYNYSTDPVQGDNGEIGLNQVWDPSDVTLHGHYAQYNLIESNVLTELEVSDTWGPSGPGNTYFRNEVRGDDGIELYDHSNTQNFLANSATTFTDDGTSQNTVLHGNKWGNADVQWMSGASSTTFPASYYRAAAPDWWGETRNWPILGSDLLSGGMIPAEERYLANSFIDQPTVTRSRAASRSAITPTNWKLYDIQGHIINRDSHTAQKLIVRSCTP